MLKDLSKINQGLLYTHSKFCGRFIPESFSQLGSSYVRIFESFARRGCSDDCHKADSINHEFDAMLKAAVFKYTLI